MEEMRMQIKKGWLDAVQTIVSPNYNQRPSDEVSLLVIHNISLPPAEFGGEDIIRLFTNELKKEQYPDIYNLTVSSHFLIRRGGEIIQFVSMDDRAWHAGVSNFQGRENCNDFSIGIELEGADSMAYTDAQYHALVELTQLIQAHYPLITKARITGHEHIAPGRKTDPGPAFDWERYFAALEGNHA